MSPDTHPTLARVRTVTNRLLPLAAQAPSLPAYYLEAADGFCDGADYCLPCATATLAHIAHGEYGLGGYTLHSLGTEETDRPRRCATCGALLDYALNDDGAEEELAHFAAHPPTALNPHTATELLALCDAYAHEATPPPALLALLDHVEALLC